MTAAPPVALGSVLEGRYRMDTLLGKGGMGAVYLGRDLRLEREVAIKVILPERVADAEAVARFLREARSAAALNHPGIVTIHDVGQAATGEGPMPYLVMERLAGEPLADRLARGVLDPEATAALGGALLDALAVAHRAGIVHRDIKPDNVFLRAPEGMPTLVDFGVARMVDGGTDPTITREGHSVGTPLYMAPEQLRGGRAEAAADLYAVGALLYEALLGRPTYHASTYPELIAKKLLEDPDLTALQGTGRVGAVVASALSRDPAARPPSAEAMAAQLRGEEAPAVPLTRTAAAYAPTTQVATPPPVSDHSPTPPSRPVQPPRRWPVLALGAAVASALVVGVAWPEDDEPIAAPTPVASQPPTLALSLIGRFHDASGSDRSLLRSPDLWRQCIADAERSLAQPQVQTRWRAARAFCRGMTALEETRADEAVRHLEEAVALEPGWAVPRVPLAHALAAKGEGDAAIASAHEAARLEPTWWVPAAALGSLHARHGRDDEAIQAYRRAMALAPNESSVVDALALAYHAAAMDEQAAVHSQQALALDPGAPWAHLIEAERALEGGDGAAALRDAEATLAVHPRSPAATLARADAYILLGRDVDALRSYERTLELVGDTEATGLPAGRLAAVRAALEAGSLPAPRAAGRTAAAEAAEDTVTAGSAERSERTRPGASGSQPSGSQPSRAQPSRSQPARSRPRRARPDRSRPDPLSGIDGL